MFNNLSLFILRGTLGGLLVVVATAALAQEVELVIEGRAIAIPPVAEEKEPAADTEHDGVPSDRGQETLEEANPPKDRKAKDKKAPKEKGDEKKPKQEKQVDIPSGYEDAPVSGEAVRAGGKIQKVKQGEEKDFLKRKIPAQARAREKQILPQFQKLVKVERSFLLRAADLDESQQRQIAQASDRCAKVAARRYALRTSGRQRGEFAAALNGGFQAVHVPQSKDPRTVVKKELFLVVEKALTPEQKKKYLDECQKLEKYAKKITVLNLIAMIDDRRMLSPKQQSQLTESLLKNFDPTWRTSLRNFIGNTEYLPQIKDRHVVKFLDEKQKILWSGIQKVSWGTSEDFGFQHNAQIIEDKFAATVNKEDRK